MHPGQYEINEVGNAFVTIGSYQYSPAQYEFFNQFLSRYALDFDENKVKKIFYDKLPVADAIKTLNEFADLYQNEKDVYMQFQDEIIDLMIMLNENIGE